MGVATLDRPRLWSLAVVIASGGFVALSYLSRRNGVPGPFGATGGVWFLLLAMGALLAAVAIVVALVLPERPGVDVVLARIAHWAGTPVLAAGVSAWILFGAFLVFAIAPGWMPPMPAITLRIFASPTAYAATAIVAVAGAAIGAAALVVTRGRGNAHKRADDVRMMVSGCALALSPWVTFAMLGA